MIRSKTRDKEKNFCLYSTYPIDVETINKQDEWLIIDLDFDRLKPNEKNRFFFWNIHLYLFTGHISSIISVINGR